MSLQEPQIPNFQKSDFHYELPDARIAAHPLPNRSNSKLLQYKSGTISHHIFNEVPDLLPPDSLLVGNDTKVIQARIYLHRASGAKIELLLLHPIQPLSLAQAMQTDMECTWECMIGNKKKWKPEETLIVELEEAHQFSATWVDREKNLIRFNWEGELGFAAVLEQIGTIPLPPYIKREVSEADSIQYQTVFAQHPGAVAAPTAGLHFTADILSKLQERSIQQLSVTLHVGAGTFLPVKEDEVARHEMHREQMVVLRETVTTLRKKLGNVIAIGTTSMRLLESLYWLGLQLRDDPPLAGMPFLVPQYAAYVHDNELPSAYDVLGWLEAYMLRHHLDSWTGETQIFILPGYSFKIVSALFTNFHLPQSTLIMLIAAFIGEDWRKVYTEALSQDYRFLSYGDGSLLWRNV